MTQPPALRAAEAVIAERVERAEAALARWTAPIGRAYAGCPTCGMVTTVVNDGTPTDLPWCIHHDGTIVWRSGSAESGWTPMVLVTVIDNRPSVDA